MSMVGCYCTIEPGQLAALIANPDGIDDLLRNAPDGSIFDVDKEWEAIHFVLTGDIAPADGPLGAVVHGGIGIGPDNGYGPVRYLDLPAVKSIADAIGALSSEDVANRYNPEMMEEVYPEGEWSDPDSDFNLDGLQAQFERVRTLFLNAAGHKKCVLLWIG